MKILLVANTAWNIVNYRWGLVDRLRSDGHQVLVGAPEDETVATIMDRGVPFYDVPMSRTGTNPLRDLALQKNLERLYRHHAPDVVLHYTIKPNIYGTLAAFRAGIPSIVNVSGLGAVFQGASLLRVVVERLYRYALRRAAWVFFQNPDDRALFLERRLVPDDRAGLLPGSGVDTTRFAPPPERGDDDCLQFLLVARLLWDKGVGEYAEAARRIRADHPEARFLLAGPIDNDSPTAIPRDQIDRWAAEGVLTYTGYHSDIRGQLASCDCFVLPSYYREGVPRVLLEAASMARPIVTTDSVGCREAVDDGVTGVLCQPRDARDLERALRRLIDMSREERRDMGAAARAKMKTEFDESIVIERYCQVIARVTDQG